MIEYENTILSNDLFTEDFNCNLSKCKGICCIEGDGGAPVDPDEIAQMEDALPSAIPYMTEKGKQVIEKQGVAVIEKDGSLATPLVNDRECAFVVFEPNGMIHCAFEKAYREGNSKFIKPISCHLYPIRIQKLKSGKEALNYDRWDICSDACSLGGELKTKIYQFAKTPLIRKYGADWYGTLEEIDKQLF